MLTLTEIESWFDDLNKIIFDVNVTMKNINRIVTATDENEKIILKHGFFSHFYRQSRFTLIVQLCKIFSKTNNQKRNLHKLFNRLESDRYDEEIDKQFQKNASIDRLFQNRDDIKNEIERLRKEVEGKEELIDRIVTLRDKVYAHSDPSPSLPKVTIAELENLVDLSIKIYNTIRGGLLDINFMFDVNAEWRVDYPIEGLAKLKEQQLKGTRAKIN